MSEDAASGPKLSGFGLLALAVLVVGIAILLVSTNNRNEAPFTSLQVHPKLTGLRVLPQGGAGQYVAGRVEVGGAAASTATYELIVVDDRLHRVLPSSYGVREPQQRPGVDSGWDEAAASLRERFDWRPAHTDRALRFPAGRVTTVPFLVRMPQSPPRLTDLSVVLALTHGSDHVYWAVKLN